MAQGSWAAIADEVLAEVFGALPEGATEREVRLAMRAAYPFGPRSHWPYKAWLSRCRAWRAAHRLGMRSPPATSRGGIGINDHATLNLFSAPEGRP
jgi:hypothetical protein